MQLDGRTQERSLPAVVLSLPNKPLAIAACPWQFLNGWQFCDNKPMDCEFQLQHSFSKTLSGITAALDATSGDVRKLQKLSRHANLNTLMMYDDNRAGAQQEVTNLLATLV